MPDDGLRIERLEPPAGRFGPLTYPALAGRLEKPEPPTVAVGAWAGTAPVGLALGDVGRSGVGRLQSIMVAASLRRMGLGLKLLNAFEEAAGTGGAHALVAEYAGVLAQRPALERLLAAAGWSPPKLHLIQLVGYAGAMADEGGGWRGVGGRLLTDPDYSFESWRIDGVGDEAALARLKAQAEYHPTLDPDPFAATLEPHVSLLVRRRGEIVGWVLGQRSSGGLGPGTTSAEAVVIYYASAYCDSAVARRGPLIAAFHHAFSAQAEAFGPRSLAVYRTHPAMAHMLAFTRRRFAPMAIRVDEVFSSRKALDAET